MEEHADTSLVRVTKTEDSETYQCRYYGAETCRYICTKCPIMQLMLEKLRFLEEIEEEMQ